MSWHTTSYTLIVPAPAADAALARIRGERYVYRTADDLVYGSGEYPPGERGVMRYLMVDSRSGHLEGNLRAYLGAFRVPGVDYLQTAEEIMQPMPWGVVLPAEKLAPAIAGLDALLKAMRADPGRCQALWDDADAVWAGDSFRPEILQEAWPEDAAVANEWAHGWARDTEGSDFACVPAFFHAHRQMLKLAQVQGRVALYAVESA